MIYNLISLWLGLFNFFVFSIEFRLLILLNVLFHYLFKARNWLLVFDVPLFFIQEPMWIHWNWHIQNLIYFLNVIPHNIIYQCYLLLNALVYFLIGLLSLLWYITFLLFLLLLALFRIICIDLIKLKKLFDSHCYYAFYFMIILLCLVEVWLFHQLG